MSLGNRITELRKQREMSQEELAVEMHVSRQSISKWENGLSNPDTENLIRLAEIFEVDLNVLIGAPDQNHEVASQENSHEKDKKTIRFMGVLLGISVCIIAVLSTLLLLENREEPNAVQATTQGQYLSHWELVSMQAWHGPLVEEIQLTEADKTALANRIWECSFVEKKEVDDEDGPILYGGLQIYVEFLRNGDKYTWLFTPRITKCTVLTEYGGTLHQQYEVDSNLWVWLTSYVE